MKKSDARARISDYVKNSGQERLSSEVDDNGDDVQMTADELDRCARVYISNEPASGEVKVFANNNCVEFFSASTSKGRKDAIKDVSESICLTVQYTVTNILCTTHSQEFVKRLGTVVSNNGNDTYTKKTSEYVRNVLTYSLMRNAYREKSILASGGVDPSQLDDNDDIIISEGSGTFRQFEDREANKALNEAVENSYFRCRLERGVANELVADLVTGGMKIFIMRGDLAYPCPLSYTLDKIISCRLSKKLHQNPIEEGSDEAELIEEFKQADKDFAEETTVPNINTASVEIASEKRRRRKLKATKKIVEKDSRYRSCRLYNVWTRCRNRYRKAEGKSVKKDEFGKLIQLEPPLFVKTLDIRMPADTDCTWETYFKGEVHIDHRQSIQGHKKVGGSVKQRWHWTNLWLMNGRKNCGKGGERGDDSDRVWNTAKKRWIETDEDDEKLIWKCIDLAETERSDLLDCSK